MSRHLSHLDHGAPSPCLAKTFGVPTLGAGYLLVNNPVFQLEPYGLSVLCCVDCAVGCCDNTPEKRKGKSFLFSSTQIFLISSLMFFLPFTSKALSSEKKFVRYILELKKHLNNPSTLFEGCFV